MTLHVVDLDGPVHHLPFTVEPSGDRAPSKEVPERVERIRAGLLDAGAALVRGSADHRPEAERLISAVHHAEYLDYLRSPAPATAPGSLPDRFAVPGLAQDTPVTADTWPAVLSAAAAAVVAAEVTSGQGVHSYAVIRPPGHHAGRAWHGGYCFVNNAVVAARALLSRGAGRVAILDIDYHLGNGTLDLVAAAPEIGFASIHSTDPIDFPYRFPQGAGLFGIAADPGPQVLTGHIREALAHLRAARPQALVVSVGYDILANDPHGHWSLPPEVFSEIGRLLVAAHLPLVLIQEGGYGLPSLQAAAHALALELK